MDGTARCWIHRVQYRGGELGEFAIACPEVLQDSCVAGARRVTRQRIQTLVNSLYELKLVKSISNPASQRSPLITITRKGAQTILQMRQLEGREMKLSLDDRKIKDATETITRLRTALEEQHLS